MICAFEKENFSVFLYAKKKRRKKFFFIMPLLLLPLETSFSSPFVWLSHIWQERGYLFFTSFTRNSYVCLYGRQAVNSKYFTIHACIPILLCMYLLGIFIILSLSSTLHNERKFSFINKLLLCCLHALLYMTTDSIDYLLNAKENEKHFCPLLFIFLLIQRIFVTIFWFVCVLLVAYWIFNWVNNLQSMCKFMEQWGQHCLIFGV